MQHLDEGRIAELLDGETRPEGPRPLEIEEHLESCAECQHRLASARAHRERAGELLAQAAPGRIEAPPFEEIRARTTSARRHRRHVPYRALGAAAVVMIAAGLGWYVRGMRLDPAPTTPAARTSEIVASAPAREPPSEPSADRAAPAEGGERDERAAPGAGAAAGPAAANQLRENAAAAKAQAPPQVATAEQEAPPPPEGFRAGRQDSAARAARDRLERDIGAEPAPAAPAAVGIATSAFADDAAWRAVPRADAERALGATLALVAGLPVESHRVRLDGGDVQVRTTQVLPDGTELELIQGRGRPAAPAVEEGVAAPSLRRQAARPDSMSVAAVELDGFVVTGRARISTDSLRALLALLVR